MSMIRLENVSKFYKSAETVSVGMKKINLDLSLGEFVAVTGESGSGKSTLLNVISGLDGYEDGELYLFGEETSHYTISDWEKYRGNYVGFVFQNYNIIDSFTVLQNVLLALEVQGYDPKKRRQRALELIDKVGLLEHKNQKASKLSGGEKQRAVIARALAKDCPIIVADEPTGNLDSASGAKVMELLHEISVGKLVVVVTHDYEQVKDYATRKIKMHDGEIVEDKKIKKTETYEEKNTITRKSMRFLTLLRFTMRSLFSTPKRLIFLIMMQMLMMIAFTFIFSFRVSVIRDTEVTQSVRFPNVPETRILVERKDGLDFTSDDIAYFNSLSYVTHVYENGLSFYNSLPLYIYTDNDIWSDGLGTNYYSSYHSVDGTDAATTLKASQITGSLPVAANEIVIGDSIGDFQVGEIIKLGSSSNYVNPVDDDFVGIFTIVGVHKEQNNIIYFSDAFLANANIARYSINEDVRTQLIEMSRYVWSSVTQYTSYSYNENITGRRMNLYGESASGLTFRQTQDLTLIGYFYNPSTYQEQQLTVTIDNVDVYSNTTSYIYYGEFSDEIYQELKNTVLQEFEYMYKIENRDVVSLSVKGLNSGVKTINAIDPEIYRTIYPANIPNPSAAFNTFIQGLFTGILMLVVGILLYSIVHAVTKNVMQSRKKDFAIFRSIGTSKTTLARLVVLEQISIAALSATLMFIILYVVSSNVPSIYRIIQYMELGNYVTLIIFFLFFGGWLGLRFNKRVFKQSVIESIVSSREE